MEIQALTNHLSNAMNALFLFGMIAGAIWRIVDGKRDSLMERVSLYFIMVGAFFLLIKAAHPSSTSYEILILHSGMFLWFASMAYKRYYKRFEKWISG